MLHVSRDLVREKVDYKDSPAAKNKQKLLTHILTQLHAYTHKHTPHTNTHTQSIKPSCRANRTRFHRRRRSCDCTNLEY